MKQTGKTRFVFNRMLTASHLLTVSKLFLVLFALNCLLSTGCEEKLKPSVTNTLFNNELPTQESWNATITFTDSGKLIAIIKAGHLSSFDEKKYTLLDSGVVVDFYDIQEHHTSRLTAREGRVNDLTKDLEAYGKVFFVSDSGSTLKSEELYWSNQSKKVHTPVFVDITSPDEHIMGQGFESDRGLKHYTVFKVTGQAKTDQ